MNPKTENVNRIARSAVLLCSHEEIRDEVVVFRLPPSSKPAAHRYPGKRYSLRDGSVAKLPFNRSAWFRATRYLVSSIDDVHAACERARLCADGGPGYLVPGDIAQGVSRLSLPRTMSAQPAIRDENGAVTKRAKPVGLVDALRHWLVLDVDGLPAQGHDPRANPTAAIHHIRSLLPPALANARASWQWSSSCCLRRSDDDPRGLGDACPETVGVHLRVWLDEALDQPGRKVLLSAVAAYVAVTSPGAVVDRATATYNQSIFCSVSLEGGLADPFPGNLRSGLLDGNHEVCVSDLRSQLPAPVVALTRVRTNVQRTKRPEDDETKTVAGKARRVHDTLLRATARQQTVVRAPFVRRDPLATTYGRGKQNRIAARQQIFRERALADIVALANGRQGSLPGWSRGIPDGMRTKTMRAVAALLSWLVPAHRLEAEIRVYCLHLVDQAWHDSAWVACGRGKDIISAAHLAASAAAHGCDTDGIRADRCKTVLMTLLSPTIEEQSDFGLLALRGEAVRSARRRDVAGVPTLEERRTADALSARSTRPWEAEGMSKATYYRRKAEIAVIAPEAAAAEDGYTSEGLELIAAFMSPHDGTWTECAAWTSLILSGTGIPEAAEAVGRGNDMLESIRLAAVGVGAPRNQRAWGVLLALEMLRHASSSEPVALLKWLLNDTGARVSERCAAMKGPKVMTRTDLMSLAQIVECGYEFGGLLRAHAKVCATASIVRPPRRVRAAA